MKPGLVRHLRHVANVAMGLEDFRAWEAGMCLIAAAQRIEVLEREVNGPSWDEPEAPSPTVELIGTVPPPPAALKCKHEYGVVTGKCIRCGAERKRKPRAPVAPPEGGAP